MISSDRFFENICLLYMIQVIYIGIECRDFPGDWFHHPRFLLLLYYIFYPSGLSFVNPLI